MTQILKLCLVLFSVLVANAVQARIWNLDFRTVGSIAMTMQPAEHICPKHFRPVELFNEVDDFEKLEIDRVGSALFIPNESDHQLAQSKPNLVMKMHLTGCAFGPHFLPQTGEVRFSGDLGVGRVNDVRFLFPGEEETGDQELSISYSAYLVNTSDKSAANPARRTPPPQKTGALGELYLGFQWKPTLLTDPVRKGDTVRADRAFISVFVHPEPF